MKPFCIILLCAFVALSVQVYGGVVYPTDCPGGGSDCFGKVFNESKTMMELFTNLRQNFPHAELTMVVEEGKKKESAKKCLQCKQPLSTNIDGTFTLGFKGLDLNGCKATELRCSQKGYTIEGSTSEKGIISCNDDGKWFFEDRKLSTTPCVKRTQEVECAKCAIPLPTVGFQVTKLANDNNGCLTVSVFCGIGSIVTPNLHIDGLKSLTGVGLVCNNNRQWYYKLADTAAPHIIAPGTQICHT